MSPVIFTDNSALVMWAAVQLAHRIAREEAIPEPHEAVVSFDTVGRVTVRTRSAA